ncbi:hypothetical protein M413DRAFT_226826 [Hebeloma cylindrosporum]|uniref:Uncharacterized protein n=1 Tax=Hebeloma cylindrosporum TaxID=76867 RepID=A0A0C3CWQ0_HEBCY|nr:hypothetical protein M413DRAFT_226826 [Hebeloma cylindrosporum h7]
MMDSQGRNGGTAPLGIVKLSDNKSCVSSSGLISSSSTTVPIPSSSSDIAQPMPSKSKNGPIAGGVVGGVGGIAIIVCLVLFLRRRQRTRISISRKTDLLADGPRSPPADAGPLLSGEYAITPFEVVSPLPSSLSSLSRKGQILQSMETQGQSTSSLPLMSDFSTFRTGSSSGQAPLVQHDLRPSRAHSSSAAGISPNEGGMSMYASLQSQDILSRDAPPLPLDTATTRPLQRVIMHRDIAESEEPLELPPSYSEGRAPIPGLLSSNIPAAGSSSVSLARKIRP